MGILPVAGNRRLWGGGNPQIQTADGGFGVRSNQFGFNITGNTNIPVVVESAAISRIFNHEIPKMIFNFVRIFGVLRG
jgi:hypothetical protein